MDWDISLGEVNLDDQSLVDIYSYHCEKFSFQEDSFLNSFLSSQFKKQNDIHYKLSPYVKSLDEVLNIESYLKGVLGSERFSLLPRSQEGLSSKNFSYYRSLKSYQQKIGFFRFTQGSSSDQPYWWQWPSEFPQGFYAIIGRDIEGSLTPSFHLPYFKSKKMYPIFLSSDLQTSQVTNPEERHPLKTSFGDQRNKANVKDEVFSKVRWACQNGLKVAAVTSPYKKIFYKKENFAETLGSEKDFSSVNTVCFGDQEKSYNTDYKGLKLFLKSHLREKVPIVVWGGGALKAQIKDIVSHQAWFYSARTGQLRDSQRKKMFLDPLLEVQLIWASGNLGREPSQNMCIKKVIDLDYKNNSAARRYCYKNHIEYVGGLDFFVIQAQYQQKIWEQYEF